MTILNRFGETKMVMGHSVRLTPLRSSDAEILFQWINERREVLFNAPYRPVTEGQHRSWLDEVERSRDLVIFAIRPLDDERLIGYCQLVDLQWVHRTAELRIRLGHEEDRGRGYGTEAIRLLVSFAFGDLNLRRVTAHVFASNARAGHVYEKVGFVKEGLLRKAAHLDGAYVDILVMGILREDT